MHPPVPPASAPTPCATPSLSGFIDLAYAMLFLLTLPYYSVRALGRREMLKSLVPERLGYVPHRRGDRRCLWVHAVSVGEVMVVRPFVRLFRERYPDWDVVVSTITETGQAVARKAFPDLQVFYFPLDFSFAVRRCLRRIRPSILVLTELEIWPNFIVLAHAAGVRQIVVNGRVTQRSLARYLWIRTSIGRILGCVDTVAAQDEQFAERLRQMGTPPDRLRITGNMKFDSVVGGSFEAYAFDLSARLGIGADDPVLVGGSTHESEEQALLDAYAALRQEVPRLRLILVPRHPERARRVEELIRVAGHVPLRKTALDEGRLPAEGTEQAVLLVDTIGELRKIYSVATVVFIGGSLIPHGGQNLLEPAALGKPVVCGPHMHNFAAACDLLCREGGARQVSDAPGLLPALRAWFADPAACRRAGERAERALRGHQGATLRNLELVGQLVRDTIPAEGPDGAR